MKDNRKIFFSTLFIVLTVLDIITTLIGKNYEQNVIVSKLLNCDLTWLFISLKIFVMLIVILANMSVDKISLFYKKSLFTIESVWIVIMTAVVINNLIILI